MKESKNIEQVFRDKLRDLESPVRADLWSNIASQAGAQTTFWSASKIAGISAAILVISGSIWYFSPSSAKVQENTQAETTEIVQEKNKFETKEPVAEAIVSSPVQQKNQAKHQSEKFPLIPEIYNVGSVGTADSDSENGDQSPTGSLNASADGVSSNVGINDGPEIEQTSPTPSQIEKKEVFEKAEQMNLGLLIAPEKTEAASRESYHFPGKFVKFFNPNLPGDAGSFTVETKDLSYFKIEIRSQKGVLVFTSNDPNFIWKGTALDGSAVPEGTYLFLIESNDLNNDALKPQSNAIFLMRK